MKPNYDHDCLTCQFVGIYMRGFDIYDMYVCKKYWGTELIARYSSYSPAYYGSLADSDVTTRSDIMRACWRMAKAKGLIDG